MHPDSQPHSHIVPFRAPSRTPGRAVPAPQRLGEARAVQPTPPGKVAHEPRVLLLGGTRGVGFALLLDLIARGTHVHVVVRGPARRDALLASLAAHGVAADAVTPWVCDLTSLAGAKATAQRMARAGLVFDRVINSAAVMKEACEVTPEGFEAAHATVLGAAQLLVDLFNHDALAPGARVIKLSSGGHQSWGVAGVDLAMIYGKSANLPAWPPFLFFNYGHAKLVDLLAGRAFQRYLSACGSTVQVLHVDPGVVDTGLGREIGNIRPRWLWRVLKRAHGWAAKRPATAAREVSAIVRASDQTLGKGDYFNGSRPARSSAASAEPEAMAKVWALLDCPPPRE